LGSGLIVAARSSPSYTWAAKPLARLIGQVLGDLLPEMRIGVDDVPLETDALPAELHPLGPEQNHSAPEGLPQAWSGKRPGLAKPNAPVF